MITHGILQAGLEALRQTAKQQSEVINAPMFVINSPEYVLIASSLMDALKIIKKLAPDMVELERYDVGKYTSTMTKKHIYETIFSLDIES